MDKTGIEKLKQSVINDCNEGQGCFNESGCNHQFYEHTDKSCKHISKCFHKYCDKYKWIIERTKHYSEKTGIPYEKIIEKWEEDRSYWYMNYYQDCNQPEIKDNVKIFDTVEQLIKEIGKKEFRCPACGEITDNPHKCKKCNWASYGLLRTMGKGVYVFVKDKLQIEEFFMPVAWESKECD